MAIPFGRNFPEGLVPAAIAQDTGTDLMSDKDGLIVHNDRPLNAETARATDMDGVSQPPVTPVMEPPWLW